MLEHSTRLTYVERLPFIKTLCQGQSVLDLGCADATRLGEAIASGQHLHVELSRVASRLVGVDVDPIALDLLRQQTGLSELFCYDATRINEIAESLGTFDVVVAGELIEHLSNPGLLLDGIKRLLKDEGLLLITTPNAFSFKFFAHWMLRGQDVNSDYHSVVFSAKTLANLLARHSYRMRTLALSQWYHSGPRNRLARPFLHPLYAIFPRLADTLLCVAERARRPERA